MAITTTKGKKGEAMTLDVSHAKPAAPKKAKPTKQEAAAAAVAKMRQATIDLAPVPAPSELVMMPLSLIETRKQVRTEFDEAALAELAADIAARGVLQPILLRPNPGMVNYLVIAGERRLRAARLAQLETIPAIIGDVDDDTAASMQIAENIQREDLCLADEAAAVRKLYELKGNSVTAVAAQLHKSKSWVSKRLAASCPDLQHMAREILEGGYTEDLEIILTVNKLQRLDWYEARMLVEKIKDGDAGRQTVRDAYEKVKAEKERLAAEQEARNSPEEVEKRKADEKARAHERAVAYANQCEEQRLHPKQICFAITKNARILKDDRKALDADQQKVLETHLEKIHTGAKIRGFDYGANKLVTMFYESSEYAEIEIAAYVSGMHQRKFDLAELVDMVTKAIENVC